MEPLLIGEKKVGPGNPCFIIAEAGLNHNGDPALAHQLIEMAAECGADAIKFQTYKTDELFPPDHPEYARFEKTVFDEGVYRNLQRAAEEKGLLLLSTPFDETSADLLDSLPVPAFKIGSGELTHHAFLKYIAAKGKPVILSTGMSFLDEIDVAVSVLHEHGCSQLALLHCVSSYPCPVEHANVRLVSVLAARYSLPIGFSDHTTSDLAALAAVSLGACILEKHFTLSHHLPGWDHFFSYDPDQFKQLVQSVRQVEDALGDSPKQLDEIERPIHQIARRAIYARTALQAGEEITHEKIVIRRPVGPLPADEAARVIGRRTAHAIPAGKALDWDDLE